MPEVVDVFCHWLPQPFLDAVFARSDQQLHMLERAAQIPVMVDLEARFSVMDQFEGYCQIPSIASPPIEAVDGPEGAADLARIANDAQAQMVQLHPNRFLGFVASLPMNNPEAALAEAERATRELGAVGVQVFTNVNGQPLDQPAFLQLFEAMGELGKPVWLHPARNMSRSDYPTEEVSKYDLWWALGWPYETSLAMGRLVFSGLFDRYPDLVIITHHAGGMVPMMEGRFGPGLQMLGTRNPPELADAVATPLEEPPLDAFRRFYADTATFGSQSAIECGTTFFGAERMMFGSDMPFDPEQGPGFIRATLSAINGMFLSPQDRNKILSHNALSVLGLAQHDGESTSR